MTPERPFAFSKQRECNETANGLFLQLFFKSFFAREFERFEDLTVLKDLFNEILTARNPTDTCLLLDKSVLILAVDAFYDSLWTLFIVVSV